MSRITEMWQQGELPGWSGLYRADDTARRIDIDGAALTRYQVGEPFDLAQRLAEEPDEETHHRRVGPGPAAGRRPRRQRRGSLRERGLGREPSGRQRSALSHASAARQSSLPLRRPGRRLRQLFGIKA